MPTDKDELGSAAGAGSFRAQHTAPPAWSVHRVDEEDGSINFEVWGGPSDPLLTVRESEFCNAKLVAEKIVHAVNCHDAMLAALKVAQQLAASGPAPLPPSDPRWAQIADVIAAAEAAGIKTGA